MKKCASLFLVALLFSMSQSRLRADISPPTISTTPVAASPQASIGWFASPDPAVMGYFVAWGSATGQCTNLVDVGNTTNVIITGFSTNVTYYFTVIGYDSVGSKGPPSNEIQYLVSAPSVTAPSIVQDLTNQTAVVGSNVSLLAGVSGSSTLAFQWLFDGGFLVGATSNPLMLNNISLAQAGTYQLIVTNSAGAVTSSIANITVIGPPTIVQDLTNETVPAGASASLGVNVSGTGPFSYQWFFNGSMLSGATSNPLLINNVSPQQGGLYQVVVANPGGSVTSSVSVLSVLMAPSLLADLTNQTVVAGSNVFMSVQAAGTLPLAYQWLFNGAELPGATQSSLVLTNVGPGQGGTYQVTVANPVGTVSSAMVLTILVPPTILVDLTNQTVAEGVNVVFALGASGTSPLSYQWLYNGVSLAGATTNPLVLAHVAVSQTGTYQATLSNLLGTVQSQLVNLEVLRKHSLRISAQSTAPLAMTFAGAPLQTCTVQFSTNLNGPWQPVSALTTDPMGILSYGPYPTNNAGFFRVLSP